MLSNDFLNGHSISGLPRIKCAQGRSCLRPVYVAIAPSGQRLMGSAGGGLKPMLLLRHKSFWVHVLWGLLYKQWQVPSAGFGYSGPRPSDGRRVPWPGGGCASGFYFPNVCVVKISCNSVRPALPMRTFVCCAGLFLCCWPAHRTNTVTDE